jgi:hypothetical protein
MCWNTRRDEGALDAVRVGTVEGQDVLPSGIVSLVLSDVTISFGIRMEQSGCIYREQYPTVTKKTERRVSQYRSKNFEFCK